MEIASLGYVRLETTKLDPPVLIPGEERALLVLPLFHIYSLTACMLLCMQLGAESVIHIRFDLEAVIKDLVAKKITIFMGVPTMYTALLSYPGLAELDLTSLKYCASGGAPLPVEVQAQFRAVTGAEVNEGGTAVSERVHLREIVVIGGRQRFAQRTRPETAIAICAAKTGPKMAIAFCLAKTRPKTNGGRVTASLAVAR